MIYIIWFIGLFLICCLGLLLSFYVIVSLQDWVQDKPQWVRYATLIAWGPAIIRGISQDLTFQYTLGSLLFLEWPPKGEKMLTWRLQRHKRAGYRVSGWRFTLSIWICEKLIEKIQKDHCHA